MPAAARDAWLAWYATTPDAPCIAICSTSQGDAVCKGCGRTFLEVQRWTEMSPFEKRATWRRITHEGTAWRFNRYAERARDGAPALLPEPPPTTLRRLPRHDAARPASRRAPHRAARLAGVRRPGRGDRVQHRRHRHGRARRRRLDLAALAIGASVYISIFVGFMGMVLAVGPIAGQLYGAGKLRESGHEAAAGDVAGARPSPVPGCLLLLAPEPFLALARAEPAVAAKVRELPARPRLRAAAGARLHGVSRLQHRRVAAEGGDGAAARRRWR